MNRFPRHLLPALALLFVAAASLSTSPAADRYLWYEFSPWLSDMADESATGKNNTETLVTVDLSSMNSLFKDIIPEGHELPYEAGARDPLAEKFFSKDRPFTFVTSSGAFELTITSVTVGSGASEEHIYPAFSTRAGNAQTYHPKDDALVCIPESGSPQPKALLQLRPLTPPGRFQDRVLKAIEDEGILDYEAGKEKKKSLRDIAFTMHYDGEKMKFEDVFSFKKHIHVYQGAFPLSATRLVLVNIPVEQEPGTYISTAFLADEKGSPLHFLHPPAVSIERADLLWTVDLESDGILELIINDSYYEGDSTSLLRWTGKEFTRTPLTGDGA